MTHPLSEELRTYAQRQIDYHCDEERTAKYLRRAADEIERMQIKLEAVAVSHQNIVEYANDALAERDEWKKKCSVLYIAELTAERDELRRQVKEGDELRQEYMDEWQKEASELRRQLAVSQRNCEDLKLTVLHVTEEK